MALPSGICGFFLPTRPSWLLVPPAWGFTLPVVGTWLSPPHRVSLWGVPHEPLADLSFSLLAASRGCGAPPGFEACREGLGSSEGLRDPQLSPGPRAQAAPEAAGESQPGWHCRAPGRTGPAPAQPAKLLPPLLAVSPGPRGCSKPPAGHTAAGGEGWPCSPAAWQ